MEYAHSLGLYPPGWGDVDCGIRLHFAVGEDRDNPGTPVWDLPDTETKALSPPGLAKLGYSILSGNTERDLEPVFRCSRFRWELVVDT